MIDYGADMFVLVHGAYHGGWCWEPLVRRLKDRGHDAVAPDLPGHASKDGWIGQQEMSSYISAMIEVIDSLDTPPVLVGHSMSGAVAAGVAEQRPDKLEKVIFLAAYIPADGESVGDVVKTDPESHVRTGKIDVGGVTAITLKPGVLADAFYNDATPRQLAWVEDRIQLQAARTFREPISLSTANFGRVPKAAIVCKKDRAISAEHERWMAERAGCDPIVELDTGHSPFVTAPDLLADTLIGL
ncbi:MAG: alpha/beta fold hydrolase [Rhodospirillales bacterium]